VPTHAISVFDVGGIGESGESGEISAGLLWRQFVLLEDITSFTYCILAFCAHALIVLGWYSC